MVTAPPELREQLRELPASRLACTAAPAAWPGPDHDGRHQAGLRLLVQRGAVLDRELARLDAELDRLTAQAAPGLRQLCGSGLRSPGRCWSPPGTTPDGSQRGRVAMLWGACPIRRRPARRCGIAAKRGGNRQANTALDRIVVVRLRWQQPTRADLTRPTKQGWSKRESIRCIKRDVAREVFAAFHAPPAPANAA